MGSVEANLGQRIAGLRKLASLTQAALAERCGVATETISRIERGAAVPSLQRIAAIASILEVDLAFLFEFNEHRSSPKDEAIKRLVAVVRRGDTRDIEVLAGVASLLLDHMADRR